ncbi:MAG TPA: ribbon-helix-helix domain-containing protein [Vicinamibacterales bacterium]|nr:ribbon-helix-helix domain-containing protein [Vicinamibacterales bacterium]
MSPKQRFQVLLEPEQLAALRDIERRTGAAVARQIRMAVDRWLTDEQVNKKKTERKRAVTRKRP